MKMLMARKYPALPSDGPIDNIITRCWEAKFARVADLLSEMKRVAADQGVSDSILGDGLMSCAEYAAKRKLCKEYYSSIAEDSVTVLEDPVSQPVERTISKQQRVCKDAGYSGWRRTALDATSYLRVQIWWFFPVNFDYYAEHRRGYDVFLLEEAVLNTTPI